MLFISYIGISASAPKYLDSLDYYIRIYICLFLIWRFNPLRSHYEFTDLDRKIAFSAGVFVLTTTALNEYIVNQMTIGTFHCIAYSSVKKFYLSTESSPDVDSEQLPF